MRIVENRLSRAVEPKPLKDTASGRAADGAPPFAAVAQGISV
ncbi:hypothetical protein BJ982_001172 [Sphaerisporangium siamense]|uniref:Uncharacterized protein n=1 Tax=Sphaerisporangium siamense TaxID=795645 RepID=A0A7W7D3M8_9ACTN|nr:hypothetical protein [Sphaerisporangium siamense]